MNQRRSPQLDKLQALRDRIAANDKTSGEPTTLSRFAWRWMGVPLVVAINAILWWMFTVIDVDILPFQLFTAGALLGTWLALSDRPFAHRLLLTNLVMLICGLAISQWSGASDADRFVVIGAWCGVVFAVGAPLGLLRWWRGWTVVRLRAVRLEPPSAPPRHTTVRGLMLTCLGLAIPVAAIKQTGEGSDAIVEMLIVWTLFSPLISIFVALLVTGVLSLDYADLAFVLLLGINTVIVLYLLAILTNGSAPIPLAIFTPLLPQALYLLGLWSARHAGYRLTCWGAVDPANFSEQQRKNSHRTEVGNGSPRQD